MRANRNLQIAFRFTVRCFFRKIIRKYLAEIIIDGYTDTDGDYDYNLELSQKRSLAVAQYLTEIRENFLSSNEISELQNYLTVNGHGSANSGSGFRWECR